MQLRSKLLLLVTSAAMVAAPQSAFAWGKTGHATIADIAELNLNSTTWSHIQTLLAVDGVTHMSKVASWADTQRDPTDPIHTTRIPIDGSGAPSHACPGTTALCADEAIAYYSGILADTSQSNADREVALKYIIHLVGDLHQPLHGSDPIGYNNVTLNGTATTIHAVWDDDIINAHGLDSATLAQELINNGVSVTLGGTPRDWAQESSDMARDHIFDTLTPCWSYKAPTCPATSVTLAATYTTDKYPLVAQRLKQAGYRLAALLNSLL